MEEVEISLPIVIMKEGKWFVTSCPPLDIATQGKTEKEETVNKNLAYPIKKYHQAVYSNLSFRIIPEFIKEIQEYLQ